MSAAQDKTSVGAGRSDWRTPPDLFERLTDRYAFTYDAAAGHENALCMRYSTVDGTYVGLTSGGATKVDEKDGLAYSWRALRVFVNPPYADAENACKPGGCEKVRCRNRGYHVESYTPGINDFMAKCAAERNNAAIIVGVIPAATDTQWWHLFVQPYADVTFLRGRVKFINPLTGQPGDAPPGGTAIVRWLPDWMRGVD